MGEFMKIVRVFTRKSGWLVFLVLLLVAGVSMWLLKEATPYGLGTHNDSVQYIFGARNLLAGNGYMRTSGGGELKPITTVPPFFSTAVAGLSLTGLEPVRSARLLIILLIGLDTILLGYLAYRLTSSPAFALAGAILFGLSSVILDNFAWLMSEPLFVCLWLLCFIFWDVFIKTRRRGWLVALGIACGIAYLTRYIAVSLAATFAVVILITAPHWKARLSSLACLLIPFLLFVGGWALRNDLLVGNPVNRSLRFHPVTIEKLQFGIDNFWAWLLPDNLKGFISEYPDGFHLAFMVIFALFAAGTFYVLVTALRKNTPGHQQVSGEIQGYFPLAVFTLTYPVMTLLSMSIVDASTILDHRLLIPFYLSAMLLLLGGLAWLYKRQSMIWKVLSILIVVGAAAWAGVEGWRESRILGQNGLGFTSLGFTASPTIRYIENMPDGIIYSNRAYMVYILTDRLAYMLTGTYDPVTAGYREYANQEIADMRTAVAAGKAYLVYFKDEGYASDPWYQTLSTGLRPIEEFSDGIIFMGSR
jgi:4-amino-4-deoxy-L-arabinose transferase-like glycosyltransferase